MPQPSAAQPDSDHYDAPSENGDSFWTPVDPHICAAKCHEMAAAQHYLAARLHAEGDHAQAGSCAMQAREQGEQGMHHGQECCRYHTSGVGAT